MIFLLTETLCLLLALVEFFLDILMISSAKQTRELYQQNGSTQQKKRYQGERIGKGDAASTIFN